MYASFLGISGALDLDVFEQPASSDSFSNLLVDVEGYFGCQISLASIIIYRKKEGRRQNSEYRKTQGNEALKSFHGRFLACLEGGKRQKC
jgi:hypothetical protein